MDKLKIKEEILNGCNFRHACKLFDENKEISHEDMGFILETGRLSPSSFGMEGTRYIVVRTSPMKEKLKPACWNQNQITSCSHLVIFITKTEDLKAGSDWVKERFLVRGLSKEATEAYNEKYKEYLSQLKSDDIYQWAARQSYISLGNMMSAAASLGIDSCAIEGFEKDKVEEILELDTDKEELVVMCAFGYRANEQNQKIRVPLNEMVEYR
ncbi:MAG: NAD(P)H-dependent oxidoreductase [Campylobacterales bacterium]|nr:NAD(P)H-dependent oxidoreductase [Campylobacterales bacterium]